MSKFLKLINENYKLGEVFTSYEFSQKTGYNSKVCAMVLRRLSNSIKLGRFLTFNGGNCFYSMSIDEINEQRKKENKLIEKYNLKQNKYKILKPKH